MAQVIDTGQAILVDLLSNHAGTFLVSRLPLRDAQGEVIGAFGMVLLDHPETTMQPLMQKFARLQGELDSAQPATGRAAPHQAHHRQLHRQQRGGAGGQAPGALGGDDRFSNGAAGRDRHRQGTAGACHPRRQPRAARPVRRREHRRGAETLLEAEFSAWRRAPTRAPTAGARRQVQVADGGTLFLDEIGDMPLALQSKLLRVLQEQGSSRWAATASSRWTCASSPPPAATWRRWWRRGEFRADLYYRLNVC